MKRAAKPRIRTKFTMTEDPPAGSTEGSVMANIEAAESQGRDRIALGDPVPWFGAPLLGDGAFSLQVAAGRWIVLSFLGSPANPKVKEELAQLLHDAQLFHEDRVVFYGVLTAPPADPSFYIGLNTFAISFIADYDGAITRTFGASDMPRTIVLDPMLRAVADIPWNYVD